VITYFRQDERDARVDPIGLIAELADSDQFQKISFQLVDLKIKKII
jgi:hypothetical protein